MDSKENNKTLPTLSLQDRTCCAKTFLLAEVHSVRMHVIN